MQENEVKSNNYKLTTAIWPNKANGKVTPSKELNDLYLALLNFNLIKSSINLESS